MNQREILQPVWDDENKTRINCYFRYTLENKEQRVVKASITNEKQPDGTDNPDWVEVMETFGAEEVDRLTELRNQEIANAETMRQEERERQKRRDFQENLFDNKLEVFQIEQVYDSEDMVAKSALRRAKTVPELFWELSKMAAKHTLKEIEESGGEESK